MFKKITILTLFIISFFLINFSICKAEVVDPSTRLGKVVGQTGLQDGYSNFSTLTGNILKAVFSMVGLTFFILMVYAGITWLTSQGEEDKITKSRNTIIASMIGIAVVVGSYAITSLVSDRLISGKAGESSAGSIDSGGDSGNLGCCIDWVQTQGNKEGFFGLIGSDAGGLVKPIPAGRITTLGDCELQGTNNGRGDYHSGPRGVGYWEFFPDTKHQLLCNKIIDEYMSGVRK